MNSRYYHSTIRAGWRPAARMACHRPASAEQVETQEQPEEGCMGVQQRGWQRVAECGGSWQTPAT